MEKSRVIWKHEEELADRIARGLLERSGNSLGWKAIFFPSLIVNYIRFRKSLFVTRKNLLFTRRLAFDAAVEISQGQDRESVSDTIDKKTKEILLKDRKGLYNEKVRRKQMSEIDLLIDHYIQFLNSDKEDYEKILRQTYRSRKGYQSFLKRLQSTEHDIIKASISTMKKGSKKERIDWFRRVEEVTINTRMEEVEKIFPGG